MLYVLWVLNYSPGDFNESKRGKRKKRKRFDEPTLNHNQQHDTFFYTAENHSNTERLEPESNADPLDPDKAGSIK